MKYDYNPLRGKIREVLGSESNLATVIHMNRSTLSQKLNNLRGFTQQDMVDILDALKEPYCKAGLSFYSKSFKLAAEEATNMKSDTSDSSGG